MAKRKSELDKFVEHINSLEIKELYSGKDLKTFLLKELDKWKAT